MSSVYSFPLFLILFSLLNAHIIIKSPSDLSKKYKDQKMNITINNFGLVPYGISIEGKPSFYTLSNDGCDPFPFQFPKDLNVDESPIMILTLGSCSAITKVINAQKTRAHAVILINNHPKQNISDVHIYDYGRGSEVSIPSLVISYEDGKILTDYYNDNINNKEKLNSIKLNIEFEMEHPDNIVEYDLYYSPDNIDIYALLSDIYYYDDLLGSNTELRIHFAIFENSEYNEGTLKEIPNCFGSGKYCVSYLKEGVNGFSILEEILSQRCIYNYAYKNNKRSFYWDYMEKYYSFCVSKNIFSKECSHYVQATLNMPTEEINKCIYDSYVVSEEERKKEGFEKLVKNNILEEELKYRQDHSVNQIPSLFINERSYLGNWRSDYIFEALCAGLLQKPEVCYEDTRFTKVKSRKNNETWGFALTILIIIILNMIIYLICVRCIKRRVRDRLNETDINGKINSIVSSYLAMNEIPDYGQVA